MQLSHLQSSAVFPQWLVELQQKFTPYGSHSDSLPLWSGKSEPHLLSPLHFTGTAKESFNLRDWTTIDKIFEDCLLKSFRYLYPHIKVGFPGRLPGSWISVQQKMQTYKGQIKSKSRLASRKFSQKMNRQIWFVCRKEEKSKQNKFVRSFFGKVNWP